MTKIFGRTPNSRIPDLLYNYEQKDRSFQGCLMEGGQKAVIRVAGTEKQLICDYDDYYYYYYVQVCLGHLQLYSVTNHICKVCNVAALMYLWKV